MKKTYIAPDLMVVTLGSRDALLQSVSGTNSLTGTSWGGTTQTNSIEEADVKSVSDVNVWDKEW